MNLLHSFIPVLQTSIRGRITSQSALVALISLRTKGPLVMTALSAACEHSTAAATGMVDRLEKDGYVKREHGSADRRVIHVHLTTKGTEFLQSLESAAEASTEPA